MKSLLVAILALGLVGCGPREPTEFERYKQACYNKGGAVSTVEVGSWTVEFQCVSLQENGPELLPRFKK